MSTAGPLHDRPKKTLADMARRRGIHGWDSMDKGALVKALSRPAPSAAKKVEKPKPRPARVAAKTASAPKLKPKPKPQQTKPVAKSTAKPNISVGKPAAKALPKTAAAKVTRPATAHPAKPTRHTPVVAATAAPIAAPRPAAKPPTTNGSPRTVPPSTSSANGSAKATTPPSMAKPAAASGKLLVPGAKPMVPGAKPGTAPTAGKPTTKPTAGKPGSSLPPAKSLPPVALANREPAPRLPSVPQAKDRVILAVRDPYWLHVWWELAPQSVQRAEAALKQDWYGAKPIIRLSDVTSQDTTSTSETPIRDILIEGEGRNWYINVSQPPRQYRADIGYLSRRGDFFPIARSNVVTPPKAGSSEAFDTGWDTDPKKLERTLAMSTGFESAGNPELKAFYEKKFGLRIGPPKETSFGTGATPPGNLKPFFFNIDAKLLVQVETDPTAHVTLGNDPIKLNPDGTYVTSFNLPDSRQIIPAVATSADGVEERTIVLAVERNTKYLDPMIHDQMNEV